MGRGEWQYQATRKWLMPSPLAVRVVGPGKASHWAAKAAARTLEPPLDREWGWGGEWLGHVPYFSPMLRQLLGGGTQMCSHGFEVGFQKQSLWRALWHAHGISLKLRLSTTWLWVLGSGTCQSTNSLSEPRQQENGVQRRGSRTGECVCGMHRSLVRLLLMFY